MKKIILLLSVLSVLMLIGCGSKKNEGESEAVGYTKIQIQFQNEYMDVTDEEKIKELEYLFDEANWSDEEPEDDRKGWTYTLTAYDADGNTKKVVIINDEYLHYEDKYYKISKEGTVKLIDEISGIDRYKIAGESGTVAEEAK